MCADPVLSTTHTEIEVPSFGVIFSQTSPQNAQEAHIPIMYCISAVRHIQYIVL
jgi:hypothetical protein